MKTTKAIKGHLLLFMLCVLSSPALAQVSFEFTSAQRGPLIGSLHYGIFYEEINHGGDGGLYAELIRNRSFEDNTRNPDFWQKLGNVKPELVTTNLLNKAQGHALKLTVNEKNAGIRNEGFWGIGLVEGETYKLTFWARTEDISNGTMRAELQDENRQNLGRTDFEVNLTNEWQKYEVELTATSTHVRGWLALKALEPMVIYLDVVSLMPPTFMNRPNGCRRDLAEMLAALHPRFVRFPGGCYIEGTWSDGQTNRFEWRKTIGPIEERPGHMNVNWGYRVSDGLGLHELLQLTEDLGAEPLFVCNVGLGHGWMQDYQNLNGYIQETLDLIEYCNGDTNTPYGAMRAANGHPKPFNLRLIEIGNENYNYTEQGQGDQSDHYAERYRQFYNAIKAKWPSMVLIGNVESWGTDYPSWRNGNPVEVVDEHYYRSTNWFAQQYNKYDHFNRDAYQIYAGEYAVTSDFGTLGNLNAALGEAIFMAGMERNSDVCIMASYAPIFCNENHPSPWMPDMIRFNASSAVGTPSYWVQQLMATNVGHQNIIWQESGNTDNTHYTSFALSSWATSVTYDNLKVTDYQGQTLYATDFTDAQDYQRNWSATGGAWNINGGTLSQTSTSMQGEFNTCSILTGDECTIELDAIKRSGNEGFLIAFGYNDPRNYIWWNLGGWNNTQHAIEQCVGGSKTTLAATKGSLQQGKTYHLRIVKTGSEVYCYLDDTLVHHITLPEVRRIYTCAALTQAEDTLILKMVNMGNTAQETTLRFRDFEWTGRVEQLLLSHSSGTAENTLKNPLNVSPIASSFAPADEDTHLISHSVPAHSLCILRIPVRNVSQAMSDPSLNEWTDITNQLQNASFSEGKTGWSGTAFSASPGTVAEFFNTNFDTFQTLPNMPAGKYRLTIDGFYRQGSIDKAWADHTAGNEHLNALLYILADGETFTTPFMSLYDESAPFDYAPTYTFPDNVTQANLAFNMKGAYRRNTVEATLTSDSGRLRVGIRKTTAISNDWTCFDNAHLYYSKGSSSNVMLPEEKKDTWTSGIFNMMGQRLQQPPKKGIYIKDSKKRVN